MPKKYNNIEFINKAIAVHGNRYDYSKTIYLGYTHKVNICCVEHGIFKQYPGNHLRGCNCPSCSNEKNPNLILSAIDFIKKAENIHGKYDYSLVEYVNSKNKINIVCNMHGEFKQSPTSHLNGNGCPKCSGKNKTTNEFIIESNTIHNNKYEYSLVNYKNATNKVEIICPEHGKFFQMPSQHISGFGCPKCSDMFITTKKFITKANSVHDNLYEYSLTNYINAKTKVIIVCKKHGSFSQRSSDHLRGHGCPQCKKSFGENLIAKYLSEKNIYFEREKTFSKCRGLKRMLPFDFYLSQYNLLIEFDGEQHHKIINYWGGKEKFSKQIVNDNIKNDFAKKENIKLLRIKYSEINNIKLIINNIL